MARFASGGQQAKLSLRSYYWGPLVVVVARGEIDANSVHRFDDYLRKLQGEHNLIVDLLDVTRCEYAAVKALRAAQKRGDDSGWGFAVIADDSAPCIEPIERANRRLGTIRTFSNRHSARAALQPGYIHV